MLGDAKLDVDQQAAYPTVSTGAAKRQAERIACRVVGWRGDKSARKSQGAVGLAPAARRRWGAVWQTRPPGEPAADGETRDGPARSARPKQASPTAEAWGEQTPGSTTVDGVEGQAGVVEREVAQPNPSTIYGGETAGSVHSRATVWRSAWGHGLGQRLTGRQPVHRCLRVIAADHDRAMGQPAPQLSNPLLSARGQRLGGAHGFQRSARTRPHPFGPGKGHQAHPADPAPATGFDEMPHAEPPRIAVATALGKLPAPASLKRFV